MIIVEWARAAQADLARIDEHLAEIDPGFADRVGAAAIGAARFLAQWPNSGAAVGFGTRNKTIVATPYILLYRLAVDRIQILRVRHVRENWFPS
ncbi:MAG TPA: type II toxin-antitoxin system RelE/ParE family toxin [Allosphingosinicella sp.]